MRYVILMTLIILLSACTRTVEHLTPKEQEDQEERMRYFLEDTSPRNMNDHPKVTPEFNKTFNLKSSPKKTQESTVEVIEEENPR
jgi:hypothetical protein